MGRPQRFDRGAANGCNPTQTRRPGRPKRRMGWKSVIPACDARASKAAVECPKTLGSSIWGRGSKLTAGQAALRQYLSVFQF
jgi:hypothetical protein